jgi:thiol-disulfide isomerase/thioredoxin
MARAVRPVFQIALTPPGPARIVGGSMNSARTRDRLVFGLVAFAAAVAIVAAIAKGRARPPAVATAAHVDSTQFSLPLLDGGKASIRSGRVTVVDFWATWCAPCRASMPRVQRVWQEYSSRGADLFSVNTDDPGDNREAAVKEFLLKNGLQFPVVLDDGTATSAFSVANLPTMLVLDQQARVVWNHVGELTGSGEKELRVVLDRALTGKNPPG